MGTDGSQAPGTMPAEVVSVTGRRDHNEDVGLALRGHAGHTPVTLLLVADGMGGHAYGEVASRLAADALAARWHALLARLRETEDPEADVRTYFLESYAEAERLIHERGDGNGMGTTLVAALLYGDCALLANVGDSRAYLVRDEGAVLVTEDHSVVADAVRQGVLTAEEAETSPFQHALTRALDGTGDAEPDLYPAEGWLPLRPDAAILLCSDGLSGVITEADLHEYLARTPDLGTAARSLIALALERGTPDNVTLALAEYGSLTRSGEPPMSPEQIAALLSPSEDLPDTDPGAAPERDVRPRDGLGRTPWVLGVLAVVLCLIALLIWAQQRERPVSRLRGSLPPVSPEPPRPVPSAFALTTDPDALRWDITGVATRDDSVRVTVSFPADTLTQTIETVGQSLDLVDLAAAWPGGEMAPGEYVWRVEARSLSGSRLRSGPADLVLAEPVRALDSPSFR